MKRRLRHQPVSGHSLARLRKRGVLGALEAELEAAGITNYRVEVGSRHAILVLPLGEVERRLPIPGSPRSEYRARLNVRSQLRRILREAQP